MLFSTAQQSAAHCDLLLGACAPRAFAQAGSAIVPDPSRIPWARSAAQRRQKVAVLRLPPASRSTVHARGSPTPPLRRRARAAVPSRCRLGSQASAAGAAGLAAAFDGGGMRRERRSSWYCISFSGSPAIARMRSLTTVFNRAIDCFTWQCRRSRSKGGETVRKTDTASCSLNDSRWRPRCAPPAPPPHLPQSVGVQESLALGPGRQALSKQHVLLLQKYIPERNGGKALRISWTHQ